MIVRIVVIVGLAALALPVLVVLGFAARYDLDLAQALELALYEPPRFTVDPASVPIERGFRDPVWVGNLENVALDEVSGLAPSRRAPNVLWAINDSGGEASVYAFDGEGRDLGELALQGVTNFDWEDLSSFFHAGQAYLLVADVGDNYEWRPRGYLHVVLEPSLGSGSAREGARRVLSAPPVRTLSLTFPDGPRDCEAVAVDPLANEVLLLAKRRVPAELYAVPLFPQGGDAVVARRIGSLAALPQPSAADLAEDPEYGEFRSRPTGMDVSADGRRLVVLTYKDAYLYRRSQESGRAEDWAAAIADRPTRIPLPPLEQGESVTFSASGRELYVTSEMRPAPLFRLDPS